MMIWKPKSTRPFVTSFLAVALSVGTLVHASPAETRVAESRAQSAKSSLRTEKTRGYKGSENVYLRNTSSRTIIATVRTIQSRPDGRSEWTKQHAILPSGRTFIGSTGIPGNGDRYQFQVTAARFVGR